MTFSIGVSLEQRKASPVLGGGSWSGKAVVSIPVEILEGARAIFQIPRVVLILQKHLLRKAHLRREKNKETGREEGGERGRERKTDRDRQTETDRPTETDKQRDRE